MNAKHTRGEASKAVRVRFGPHVRIVTDREMDTPHYYVEHADGTVFAGPFVHIDDLYNDVTGAAK